MSDIIIFGIGCFVSLVVTTAVGLLLWGAAHESDEDLAPARPKTSSARSSRPEPSSAGVLDAQSPA